MFKYIVLIFLASVSAYGQCGTLVKNPITKMWDCAGSGGGGSSSLLSGTLAAIPATCTPGAAIYQATDRPIGAQLYQCTSVNTWTLVSVPYTYNSVAFSATPLYTFGPGDNTFKITLTSNITSSTTASAVAGQKGTFILCQDGTGGRTNVWPTTFKGTMTIGSTLSLCSTQTFIYDGTNFWATSTGNINQ